MKKDKSRPSKENSTFKLWIGMKVGENINTFSYPDEEKRLNFQANKVFSNMFERYDKKYHGQYTNGEFREVKSDKILYVFDETGKVKRPDEQLKSA